MTDERVAPTGVDASGPSPGRPLDGMDGRREDFASDRRLAERNLAGASKARTVFRVLRKRRRRCRALLAVPALLIVLAACGGGESGSQSGAVAGDAGDRLDLKAVCPSTIVIQTSWLPDAVAAGALYHLLGPGPDVDAGQKRVTAPLLARGKDTGVKLELRAGGPAIGFTQTSAQMYLDTGITLGMPKVDEQIQLSAGQPTLAVLSLLEIDPGVILWDPVKHPEFSTIQDIGRTQTTVLYFGGDTYMEYLIGSGILKRSQVDGSQDGSPARFVAAGGDIAQAGYATVDPYTFKEEVKEWGKPVKFQLVYDTGYPNYGEILAMRAGDKDKLAPCLRKLVPIVQQAQVDLLADPARTIDLTANLNEAYKSGIPYTTDSAEFAVNQAKALGLIGNGDDGSIGNFDESRVQRMIDITKPIFAAQKKPIKDGLTPAEVVTNEFIEAKIGLATRS